jgi:hypothetical protein
MVETDNVILAHLLHIRAAIDGARNDSREPDRLDRMEARIEHIEHRLDLTDV